MFANGLIGQIVQTSSGDISLELLIPVLRIERQKPLAKLCQIPLAANPRLSFQVLEVSCQEVYHKSILGATLSAFLRSLQKCHPRSFSSLNQLSFRS